MFAGGACENLCFLPSTEPFPVIFFWLEHHLNLGATKIYLS